MGKVDDLPISPSPEFDMFTFLSALANRHAVINIPEYVHMRPVSSTGNQEVVSRKIVMGRCVR